MKKKVEKNNSPLAQLLKPNCEFCNWKLECLTNGCCFCGIIISVPSPEVWKLVATQARELGLVCTNVRNWNHYKEESALRISAKSKDKCPPSSAYREISYATLSFYKSGWISKYIFIDFSWVKWI